MSKADKVRKESKQFYAGLNRMVMPALAGDTAPVSLAVKRAVRTRTAEDPNLVWTASNVVLLAKELAVGVYGVYPDDATRKNPAGIPVATSGGFVIGDDAVLVIESMLNSRLAGQMLALIREKTKKPILYVVNTSYHGDHSYGNQFFPKGTQFVQHVTTQQYIQSHFTDDVSFMKKYFGTNQGLEELKPQRAHILVHDGSTIDLDLGGKRVQVMHLGFGQTEGDLFIWLPKEKVLFTGNAIISDGPSLCWLLDGKFEQSLATLRKIRAMLPKDAIVVPGHGYPTGLNAVEYAIEYLEELKKQVGEAIAQGMSEEATVSRLTESMKQYSGYKIYAWVHSQINVPKVYQEMKNPK
ncbi:MAG TPA: MBL fold metallo-hydrolase [Nitrospirota bacterium]|nr:MBL fold metallo-hydrolase [Nitrospirota bacterium]